VPDRPAVVVFDVNETLSDLTPMAQRFAEIGLPEHLAPTWFASVLRDGFALAAVGSSARFAEIAGEVLKTQLRQAGVQTDPDDAVRVVLEGFLALEVHPDVVDGVRALRDAGLRLVTLSNGGAQVAERLLSGAGVRDAFEHVLSVEEAGIWKPAPAAYGYAARVCGVDLAATVMVAVHPWDTDGGARAGMRTAYVDRTGVGFPGHLTPPDLTVRGIDDLARQLTA
jgi:2-haloacid dehalogenase